MSHTSQPITPARFASALPDLPLSTLHETAAQTRNSIAHLQFSNTELAPFAAEGDAVCKEAIEENEVVIERMRGRMEMLKAEVEGRGMQWVEAEDESVIEGTQDSMITNGHEASDSVPEPQAGEATANGQAASRSNGNASSSNGGLSDEELRRRLEQQIGDLEADGDEGMHL